MKLRQLETLLQDVEAFPQPKVFLEQYTTPPHLAAQWFSTGVMQQPGAEEETEGATATACLLHTAESQFGDILGCTVADLGCGCGILSIGAALLGASYILGVDVDKDALDVCKENCTQLEPPDVIDFLQENVTQVYKDSRLTGKFQTVIMNPPYGTKQNKGIDVEFLRAAAELTTNAIYSLHKTTTRSFVCKKAASLGLVPQVVAELKYNLKATYKFHKQTSKDIEVDFIRFTKK